jgi:sugar transferase (PEP-CTERM/EpsH1 system associated)
MQILIVSTRFPFPPRWGFATRVYQLARHLAKHHDLTLLSPADGVEDDQVEALRTEFPVVVVRSEHGAPIRPKRARQLTALVGGRSFHAREFLSGELQEAVDGLARDRRFDVVQIESSLLGGLRFPREPRLVLDEHNIEYEVFRRMQAGERSLARRAFYRREYTRFRPFEQQLWRRVDGCVVTSAREREIVGTHAPATPCTVVANGVDVDEFRPTAEEAEPDTLVFNGVLDYRPNLDAALFLVEEVLPRVQAAVPGARLTIVGRGAVSDVARLRKHPGVLVTGEVPDVRPYLAGSRVVVVPIRMGGGTRLKVVEGLAMGRPMVTTTLGCEGIDVDDDRHLLIRDDADTFAAAVVTLLSDGERGAALGAAGRELIEARYSWASAAGRLEELYRALVPDARAAGYGAVPEVALAGGERG